MVSGLVTQSHIGERQQAQPGEHAEPKQVVHGNDPLWGAAPLNILAGQIGLGAIKLR
jgi:hypothetical protein